MSVRPRNGFGPDGVRTEESQDWDALYEYLDARLASRWNKPKNYNLLPTNYSALLHAFQRRVNHVLTVTPNAFIEVVQTPAAAKYT